MVMSRQYTSYWNVYCSGESLSRGVSVQEVSRGISVWGGGSLSREGGLCQVDPPYGYERGVRILLECFPS